MTQLLFEVFNTPAMYASIQAMLSLCASDGVVADSGHGVSYVLFLSIHIHMLFLQFDLGGHDLTVS